MFCPVPLTLVVPSGFVTIVTGPDVDEMSIVLPVSVFVAVVAKPPRTNIVPSGNVDSVCVFLTAWSRTGNWQTSVKFKSDVGSGSLIGPAADAAADTARSIATVATDRIDRRFIAAGSFSSPFSCHDSHAGPARSQRARRGLHLRRNHGLPPRHLSLTDRMPTYAARPRTLSRTALGLER